jgi:CRP/FNR family cyclic AMP-dependent transcriptional regulator
MTPSPALEAFIKSIPLFEFVTAQDLIEVLRLLRPVELEAGQLLFREGEPGRAMWVLGPGVEVSVTSTAGAARPVAVGYARTGDVLGEMALVDDGPRSGTALVTRGGHAHELDAQAFHAMRSTFTPAAFRVLRKLAVDLCARLRQTDARIVESSSSGIRTPPLPPGRRPEVDTLSRFPAFSALPQVVKFALAQQLDLLELPGVTPLFAEGEPADGAYFLLEGEVSVGRNGKTLSNLPAGAMFGIVACVDDGARSASCVTTGPATLLRMARRDFDTLFASGHRFAFQLVDLVARQLVQHVREANQMLPAAGAAPGVAGTARPVQAMLPAEPGVDDLGLMEQALPLELDFELAFLPDDEPPAGAP